MNELTSLSQLSDAECVSIWVNFRRWSPTETALNQLSDFAQKARQNQDIDPNSTDFQTMLKGLPSGNHMPRWAKQALRDLFVWAKNRGNGQLQDKLFELRFDKQLDDDWYLNNDPNDIDFCQVIVPVTQEIKQSALLSVSIHCLFFISISPCNTQ